MKADLHTHTKASDGEYSPKDLIKKAYEAGIELMAITDHDTVNGLNEGFEAAEKYGIKLISGVEFGASNDKNMHILGYNFDKNSESMINMCNFLKKSREERKYRIIKFLKEKGVEVTEEEVNAKAGDSIVARPHFALIMVEKGYVKNVKEAFTLYLDTEEYQKIERFKFSAEEYIKVIHEAGGKAVLAHPKQLNYSPEKLEKTIAELKKSGLDGLECIYTTHTPEEIKTFKRLADKYGLFYTAGSDFHGENIKPNVVLFTKEINPEEIL